MPLLIERWDLWQGAYLVKGVRTGKMLHSTWLNVAFRLLYKRNTPFHREIFHLQDPGKAFGADRSSESDLVIIER
jgi:hypothetical protein